MSVCERGDLGGYLSSARLLPWESHVGCHCAPPADSSEGSEVGHVGIYWLRSQGVENSPFLDRALS